jgi:hypothetical protein
MAQFKAAPFFAGDLAGKGISAAQRLNSPACAAVRAGPVE